MRNPKTIHVRDFAGKFWSLELDSNDLQKWSKVPDDIWFVESSEYWVVRESGRTGKCVTEGEAAEWFMQRNLELPERLAHLVQGTSLTSAPKGALTEPPWLRHGEPEVEAEAGEETKEPPVKMGGQGDPVFVRGEEVPPLTSTQFDVIKALLEAHPRTLTKDQLDKESGHTDARKPLSNLARSSPIWESVIKLAGKTGGGYGLRT